MTIFTGLIIISLLFINGFYVAAEFGAVSARRSRIQQLAEEGNSLAISLLPILKDSNELMKYLSVAQIGITIASLSLGAYGQATLTEYLSPVFVQFGGLQSTVAHSTSTILVLIFLTLLQMLFGELVPRALALQYSNQAALYTVLPMRWSSWVLSLFSIFLNKTCNLVLKFLGVSQTDHRHIHSPEEIDLLIAESRDGGLLEPDEQLRLHQALQLSMRTAGQLMIPRLHMEAINIDAPVDEVLQKIIQSPYTRLPAYKDSLDNIVGILHTKELLLKYIEHREIFSIYQVLKPIVFIPENVRADRLISFLRENRSHQAIVMDEFGGVAGLVALEDILSEVLGEVGDEFKEVFNKAEKLSDGRVRLPGLMRLDETGEWIGIIWEGDSHTVGGRVIEALGYLPVEGTKVNIDGVEVEIEKVKNHAIESILAKPVLYDKEKNVE